MDPQRIIAVCKANWEAHKSDCSGFVKAVSGTLGVHTFAPGDDANAIVEKLHAAQDWKALTPGDGAAAKAQADEGMFVMAGLKGADQVQPDAHGHTVIVVSGPLDATHHAYPTGYWGSLGGVGAEAQTLNYAWREGDRDRVGYFVKSLDSPEAAVAPSAETSSTFWQNAGNFFRGLLRKP